MWLTLAIVIFGAAVQSTKCEVQTAWTGCPDVSANGDTVDIYGESRRGASDQTDSHRNRHETPGPRDRTDAARPEPYICDDPLGRCGEYEVVTRPEPTLTDVASFAPRPNSLIPEPHGIGVAGLPVNVVASGDVHTVTGELFDLPVTVRFEPVTYTFDYGDGARRESATGGRTWRQLGAAQFTATDTSHTYRARGTYTATVTVHYAAAVDFGTGWRPVPGLLAVPAGATTIEVLEARTALVERTCLENPAGIGC